MAIISGAGRMASSNFRTFSLLCRQCDSEAQIFRPTTNSGPYWRQMDCAYDGSTLPVHNPSMGDIIADVPCMGARETNDAISPAYVAFNSWSRLTAAEWSKCLLKCWQIGHGASFIEFFAEEAKRVYGDIIPATLTD